MSETLDLKSLERKAYRAVFNDGLWDLFIGLIILNMGISDLLGSILNLPELWDVIITSLLWNIMAFLIFYLGKKYITIPRIGFVKFGPKRKSKELKLKFFLIIVFLVNVLLFVLLFTGLIERAQFQPLMLALLLGFGMFTFPFCVIAYFLDFTRLYYYAFSVGIGFFLNELLYPFVGNSLNVILTYGTVGTIIVLIGTYYFIRFLQKYPIPG